MLKRFAQQSSSIAGLGLKEGTVFRPEFRIRTFWQSNYPVRLSGNQKKAQKSNALFQVAQTLEPKSIYFFSRISFHFPILAWAALKKYHNSDSFKSSRTFGWCRKIGLFSGPDPLVRQSGIQILFFFSFNSANRDRNPASGGDPAEDGRALCN